MAGPRTDAPAASNEMAAVAAKGAAPISRRKGDLPEGLAARYLIEHDRAGRAERFHRDVRSVDPLFEDKGRKLVAREPYPDAIKDMLAIAAHRGWREVRVTGDPAFRRDVWIRATAEDIRVKGYRPREIDRQAAERERPVAKRRHGDPQRTEAPRLNAQDRMALVMTAVRMIVTEPAAQARLAERVIRRVSAHLEADRTSRQQKARDVRSGGTQTPRQRDR